MGIGHGTSIESEKDSKKAKGKAFHWTTLSMLEGLWEALLSIVVSSHQLQEKMGDSHLPSPDHGGRFEGGSGHQLVNKRGA